MCIFFSQQQQELIGYSEFNILKLAVVPYSQHFHPLMVVLFDFINRVPISLISSHLYIVALEYFT